MAFFKDKRYDMDLFVRLLCSPLWSRVRYYDSLDLLAKWQRVMRRKPRASVADRIAQGN